MGEIAFRWLASVSHYRSWAAVVGAWGWCTARRTSSWAGASPSSSCRRIQLKILRHCGASNLGRVCVCSRTSQHLPDLRIRRARGQPFLVMPCSQVKPPALLSSLRPDRR
jgi:hypothetical protein